MIAMPPSIPPPHLNSLYHPRVHRYGSQLPLPRRRDLVGLVRGWLQLTDPPQVGGAPAHVNRAPAHVHSEPAHVGSESAHVHGEPTRVSVDLAHLRVHPTPTHVDSAH